MAYITFKPTDHFNTKLYTGNASTNAVTGVGFAPAMSWFKSRSNNNAHAVFDALRTTYSIWPNNSDAQGDASGDGFTSLDSDGFTFNSSGGGGGTNASGFTYSSWNWKGGTTSGITTNGSTSQTPTGYSFNQTAGISVVAYTGGGTAGNAFAHGLGVAPSVVLIKSRSATEWWNCYFEAIGNTKYLMLNNNEATSTNSNRWNNTTPDAVNVTLGAAGEVNGQNGNYIAYCFAPKKGFSAMGSYIGNANANGQFIYTGFKPSWVLIKNSESAQAWNVWDIDRNDVGNLSIKVLQPNATAGEGAGGDQAIDINGNGFKIKHASNEHNKDNSTMIYMAFADQPIIGSNGTVGLAK